MNRLIAAAAVLLLGGTARADMGLPLDRRVPVRITLTADPPPGVEVFAVLDMGGVRRLPAGSSLVLQSDQRTRAVVFTVYAVQSAALTSLNGGEPPGHWFRSDNPDCRAVGSVDLRGRLSFLDSRSEVVEDYRVVRQGDWVELRKVSDNTLSWWQSGPCCLVVMSAPIALIWFGVRLARRPSRSRSVRPSEGGT